VQSSALGLLLHHKGLGWYQEALGDVVVSPPASSCLQTHVGTICGWAQQHGAEAGCPVLPPGVE